MNKEEKKMFALAKKSSNSNDLVDKQLELEFELAQLKGELYWINR